MLHKLGSIFQIFFLLSVFLFPTVEKSLHAVGHEEDVHCEAVDIQHLHNKHHNCHIADFTSDDFVFEYFHHTTLKAKNFFKTISLVNNLLFVKFPDRNYLKAPPVIV